MAKSLNKVMLIGNLTKDPVVRYTGKGTAVASFSIATNRSWVDQSSNEKVDEVEYHNLVIWNKLAEIAEQYLKKGDKAYFEGRLQTRKWQGEDGNDRYTTEVVVESMLMLGSRGAGASYSEDNEAPVKNSSQKSSSKQKNTKKSDESVTEVEDISDDIPF
jgi:single-strand DNA-binding protein